MSSHHINTEVVSDDHFLTHNTNCGICRSAPSASGNTGTFVSHAAILKIAAYGYIFHMICLSSWLNTATTCPICPPVPLRESALFEMFSSLTTELQIALENTLLLYETKGCEMSKKVVLSLLVSWVNGDRMIGA
jgi:hypothetical protein